MSLRRADCAPPDAELEAVNLHGHAFHPDCHDTREPRVLTWRRLTLHVEGAASAKACAAAVAKPCRREASTGSAHKPSHFPALSAHVRSALPLKIGEVFRGLKINDSLLLSLDDFYNLTSLIDVLKVLKVMDDVVLRLRVYEVECLAGISGVRIEAPARWGSPDLVQTPKEFFSLACLWATHKVEFLHQERPPCALPALMRLVTCVVAPAIEHDGEHGRHHEDVRSCQQDCARKVAD
jgi:hypothetical protein